MLHGPLIMKLLGGNAHFLREEFADFVINKPVVHTDGANSCATSAESAAIGQFSKTGNGRPVQLNVACQPGGDFPARLEIFLVNPAQNFGTENRAIDFFPATSFINGTGIRACLAFGTVFHRKQEWLQEGPVIFLLEKFFQAGEKLVNELLFFFRACGLGDANGHRVIQRCFNVFDLFRLQGSNRYLIEILIRRRQQGELTLLNVT